MSCTEDGVVRRWPLPGGAPAESRLDVRPGLLGAAFDRSGRYLRAALYYYETRLYDVASSRVVYKGPRANRWQTLAPTPDGGRLLVGTLDGVTCRRLPGGQAEGLKLNQEGGVHTVEVSHDGGTALTCAGTQVRLWALPSGAPRGGWDLAHQPTTAAFRPDGRAVALGDDTGAVQLWDVATARPVGPRMSHRRGRILDVAFSADGRLLASAGADNTARLWDAATGRPVGPALPHYGDVASVAFHPEGRLLASGSADRTAQVWPVPALARGSIAEVCRRVVQATGMDWDESGRVRDLPAEELYRLRRSP
jgi:WD40 repeat protein